MHNFHYDPKGEYFNTTRFKAGKCTKEEKERSREFVQSSKNKLTGSLDNGTFVLVDEPKVPLGTRIFGSHMIEELKQAQHVLRCKSRFVVQNYSYQAATGIETKAPTIQHSTQRLVMYLAASMPYISHFIFYVTKSYVQSDSNLERALFISAPQEP